jgi:hypothetical protein
MDYCCKIIIFCCISIGTLVVDAVVVVVSVVVVVVVVCRPSLSVTISDSQYENQLLLERGIHSCRLSNSLVESVKGIQYMHGVYHDTSFLNFLNRAMLTVIITTNCKLFWLFLLPQFPSFLLLPLFLDLL